MSSVIRKPQLSAPSTAGCPPAAPIDPEAAWKQVLSRDPAGEFFYAVLTTGVYCRPGCTSKLPLRKNVRFFCSAAEAQKAGFRSCKRCGSEPAARGNPLENVRAHLEAHLDRPVKLAELARLTGLSPFTVQRLFKQRLGVSPLQYPPALRASNLRSALKQGGNVTDAIYNAGFSLSSRAYEGAQLGMTPDRFAQGAPENTSAGLQPLRLLAGSSWERHRAACAGLRSALARKRQRPACARSFPGISLPGSRAFWTGGGSCSPSEWAGGSACNKGRSELPLDLRGTAFQLRVWQALRAIPRGQTVSYSELACQMGIPNATRAVARACATNRVALLVPCHRVVGASGSLTGYRWGIERKKALLAAEGARIQDKDEAKALVKLTAKRQ